MRTMNMQNAQMNRGNASGIRQRLMNKIRKYDFAIVETALFLDTHPNNQKAISYYSKLIDERKEVVAEFEKNVGPITMYGNESNNKWDWVTGPWPWEGDC